MNTLKFKCIMISNDEGRTWVVTRHYYMADMATQELLDVRLDGAVFERKNMKGDENEPSERKTVS